jgi:hypothetical protein
MDLWRWEQRAHVVRMYLAKVAMIPDALALEMQEVVNCHDSSFDK